MEIHELAYRLWQVRSMCGVHTSSEQDWCDAEKMLKNMSTEEIEKFIKDMPFRVASEPDLWDDDESVPTTKPSPALSSIQTIADSPNAFK